MSCPHCLNNTPSGGDFDHFIGNRFSCDPNLAEPAARRIALEHGLLVKAATRHFKLDTSAAKAIRTEFELYSVLAEQWSAARLCQVRLFRAGVTFVYLSITAEWWWSPYWANEYGVPRDADDLLEKYGRQHRLRVRSLRSRPAPEKSWIGDWQTFNTSEALATFANERLRRLDQRSRK